MPGPAGVPAWWAHSNPQDPRESSLDVNESGSGADIWGEQLEVTVQLDVTVRQGETSDMAFVNELADESIEYSVPPGRIADRPLVAERIRNGLAALADHLAEDRFLVLIGELGLERVGYLILDLADREPTTGEPQALIVDIAVRRSDWGRYVTHRLVREAARVAEGRGLRYLVGMISASNQRALRTAERLGFAVEREQVVMRLPATSSGRE